MYFGTIGTTRLVQSDTGRMHTIQVEDRAQAFRAQLRHICWDRQALADAIARRKQELELCSGVTERFQSADEKENERRGTGDRVLSKTIAQIRQELATLTETLEKRQIDDAVLELERWGLDDPRREKALTALVNELRSVHPEFAKRAITRELSKRERTLTELKRSEAGTRKMREREKDVTTRGAMYKEEERIGRDIKTLENEATLLSQTGLIIDVLKEDEQYMERLRNGNDETELFLKTCLRRLSAIPFMRCLKVLRKMQERRDLEIDKLNKTLEYNDNRFYAPNVSREQRDLAYEESRQVWKMQKVFVDQAILIERFIAEQREELDRQNVKLPEKR